MTAKIPCVTCGTLILPSTAEKTGGVCMPCKDGFRGGLEEAKRQKEREMNTPQKIEENITGFIVEVKTRKQTPVSYGYDTETRELQPNETFVGYFWQETDRQDDGTYAKAHIHETKLLDADKKLFSYGGQAVFPRNKVLIEIRALRGPSANNRGLARKYKKYETWNISDNNEHTK